MDCYFRALSLLSRAEHCRRGLEYKLSSRGYEKEEITAVLDRLTAEGYLDDRRYADLWIEFRLRRKRGGRQLLLAGLINRGVDRETAAQAVKQAAAGEAYEDALSETYRRIRQQGISRRVEVYSLLRRKGYSSGDIQNLLESLDENLD